MLQSYTTIDRLSTPDGGQTKRYKCPVHGGKKRSVAVWWSGGPRAYCHSRQCAQADILAALGITSTTTPSTRFIPLPAKKSDPEVRLSNATPLPPVTPAEGRAYLAGIQTERGATIQYQRQDGHRGKHWRNTDKRRNPGVSGDGWQPRRFDPVDPSTAIAVCLTEGEKDSAALAQAGLISFSPPRGWNGLETADFTELLGEVKATGLPLILAGDNDTVGRKAMLRVAEQLRKEGLHPIDTAGLAPHKGSIADLDALDLHALLRLQLRDLDIRMVKPVRNRKLYKEFWCTRLKRWQGVSGDGQAVINLRPCGNTATCERCNAWENYLHIERAWRGRPVQLVSVSGFGDEGSTIAETVGAAKLYRQRWEDRLRKTSAVHQYSQNIRNSERRNFITALTIRDDYRAGLAFLFTLPLTVKELDRERGRAEAAGLTFSVTSNPDRDAIEAVAPRSLTVSMEGVGDTDKTNTWTSSGWPSWLEFDPTYQFSDGRELEDGESFDTEAIEVRAWRLDYRQQWNARATLRTNLVLREQHAVFNAQVWVSGCVGLGVETLYGIARASSIAEVDALVAETDYAGPVALLRDVANWIAGRRDWRPCYRVVLDVAGWKIG